MSKNENYIYVRTDKGDMLRVLDCFQWFELCRIGEGRILGYEYGSNFEQKMKPGENPNDYFERLASIVLQSNAFIIMSMIDNYNLMPVEDYKKYKELELSGQYKVAHTYLIRMMTIEVETQTLAHQLKDMEDND